jgi:hypothetical protein
MDLFDRHIPFCVAEGQQEPSLATRSGEQQSPCDVPTSPEGHLVQSPFCVW